MLLLYRFVLLVSLLCTVRASAAYVVERTLASPNGSLVFTLERDDANQALVYNVTFSGRPVVTRGALGLNLSGIGVVGDEGTIGNVVTNNINTTWTNPFGERSNVIDRYREEILTINHAGQGALGVKLQVRVYDEGVALRYRIEGSGTITADKTSFPMSASTQVWVSGSAQAAISKVAISSVSTTASNFSPILAELAGDLYAAVGEAALIDSSRLNFLRSGTSTLVASLSGSTVFTGSFTGAWRFVRVASSPGALLEGNDFMFNLNEPSRVADTSWIRPGKVLREVTLTTQGARASIDFAAAHDLKYIMFDAGWYGHEYNNNPPADATKVNVDPSRSPGPLDLPAVIAYGKEKGVDVILYVNKNSLKPQLDTLLPLYQSWGVAGMKFGFVDVGSQSNTRWLHEAVAKCADHHLMVDIHDEYRPTGVSRTYPNLMTQEGIRGDEESPSNATVLNTIFVRGLAGAGDQTNCYFTHSRVNGMGSHASQLAKSICIFSPWQFLYWYDRPAASPPIGSSVLEEVPELTFFDRLPTVWDETRVIDGYPGSHATIARRKGNVWYVAGLNGGTARAFKVPLGFLDPSKAYQAEVFVDDPNVATSTKVRIDTQAADHTMSLNIPVAATDGFAAIFTVTGPYVAPPPATSLKFKQGAALGTPEGFLSSAEYRGAKDTTLIQEAPTNNYGASPTMQMGVLGSGQVRCGLIRFDVGALAGKYKTIRSMKLRLHVAEVTAPTTQCMLGVSLEREGNAAWIEGNANGGPEAGAATWNLAGSGPWLGGAAGARTAADIAGQMGAFMLNNTSAAAGSWIEIDLAGVPGLADYDTLTKIVDHWTANGGSGNAGLLLNYVFPNYTGNPQWKFSSSNHPSMEVRPELIIEFVPQEPYGLWSAGHPWDIAGDSHPGADPDHDGISNMLECVLGSDPHIANDMEKRPVHLLEGEQMSFTHRLGAAGRFLHPLIQYSDDLENWSAAIHGIEGVDITDGPADPDGTPTVRVSFPRESWSRLFVRLSATVD